MVPFWYNREDMKLSFLGAAGVVTGSNYLLETDGGTRILVDCGMFQGGHEYKGWNERALGYKPHDVHAVILTHAHLDHSGRLPRLIQQGFQGAILGTPPTLDLAVIILEDSEHMMLMHQERDNDHPKPLYSYKDVQQTMRQFQPMEYHTPTTIGDATITLHNAGHILGSASVEIHANGKTILFTGDIGSNLNTLLPHPTHPVRADHIIIESCYAGKHHEDMEERIVSLERVVKETIAQQGVLMIPSFAIERTQEILYDLNELVEGGRLPRIPMFIDSPMAIAATSVYQKYPHYLSAEGQKRIENGDNIFTFPGLTLTKTKEESKTINTIKPPKVIMAGNGMSSGGRILFHERAYLSDPRNTLLIVSFQVHGSLGRKLLEGEKRVMILNDLIHVKARVEVINSYSGHADHEQLLDYLKGFEKSIKHVWVVHGEKQNEQVLVNDVRSKLGVAARAPEYGETVSL